MRFTSSFSGSLASNRSQLSSKNSRMSDEEPGGEALGGGTQDSGREHLRNSSNNTDNWTMNIHRGSTLEEHGHPSSGGAGPGTNVPNDGYPEGTDSTDHYTSSGTINTDEDSAFMDLWTMDLCPTSPFIDD